MAARSSARPTSPWPPCRRCPSSTKPSASSSCFELPMNSKACKAPPGAWRPTEREYVQCHGHYYLLSFFWLAEI